MMIIYKVEPGTGSYWVGTAEPGSIPVGWSELVADCEPIKEAPAPFLPAEVHNPTKIDPDAAMAAVRSLCG